MASSFPCMYSPPKTRAEWNDMATRCASLHDELTPEWWNKHLSEWNGDYDQTREWSRWADECAKDLPPETDRELKDWGLARAMFGFRVVGIVATIASVMSLFGDDISKVMAVYSTVLTAVITAVAVGIQYIIERRHVRAFKRAMDALYAATGDTELTLPELQTTLGEKNVEAIANRRGSFGLNVLWERNWLGRASPLGTD
jgi:hypothetical protein